MVLFDSLFSEKAYAYSCILTTMLRCLWCGSTLSVGEFLQCVVANLLDWNSKSSFCYCINLTPFVIMPTIFYVGTFDGIMDRVNKVAHV